MKTTVKRRERKVKEGETWARDPGARDKIKTTEPHASLSLAVKNDKTTTIGKEVNNIKVKSECGAVRVIFRVTRRVAERLGWEWTDSVGFLRRTPMSLEKSSGAEIEMYMTSLYSP